MAQVRSWAGLDVHARSVLAVTVDALSGEMRTRRLPGKMSEVVGFCASLPGPTRDHNLFSDASLAWISGAPDRSVVAADSD
ncbi:MAG: hypothetical protein ACRDKY_08690 [Solirubrobacteraceae bacterium]